MTHAPGKWADPEVPKHDWTCIDVEDLGDDPSDFETCEMCEVQDIRYVHSMEHADYPDVLRCGCICAGRMEGDEPAARHREESMKRRGGLGARRIRFPQHRNWHISARGDLVLRINRFVLTVFRKGQGWSLSIHDRSTERTQFSHRLYGDSEAAQLAAFDAMLWAEERWRSASASVPVTELIKQASPAPAGEGR